MRTQLLISLFFLITLNLFGQEKHKPLFDKSAHKHEQKFRLAGFIGHTLIKSKGANSHLFIPSWGFDLEYWLSKQWGIGLHNDLEIESFIIRNQEKAEIERINPLVISLDGLYHMNNGLVFSAGPGVELEHGESFYLFRLGIEWEKEIGHEVDIAPTLFYDHRFDGFSTWTVALGIGKRF